VPIYPLIISDINITRMYPTNTRSLLIQWELDDSVASGGPFNFSVLRSGSPEGPFEIIAENLGDVYTYTDDTSHLTGMIKDVYYKVAHDTLSCTPRNILHIMPRRQYNMWRKILWDEDILLRKGNGRPVLILKRRHWGERCRECYDLKTGKNVKKHCDVCFGTTFIGGYFPPVETWASIKPSQIGTEWASETATPEMQTNNLFMPPIPQVHKGDIVIEIEINNRWEVTTEQPTEILRNPTHQDVTITRLKPEHIAYRIPT
jgi:hypothetical protein